MHCRQRVNASLPLHLIAAGWHQEPMRRWSPAHLLGEHRMIPLFRHNAICLVLLPLSLAAPLSAQESSPGPPTPSAAADPDLPEATTMETIEVIAPKQPPQVVDLYLYRNPYDRPATRFDKRWSEPMSAEEIGMRGGIVHLGIAYALEKTGKAITRLPGWKLQPQSAIARPPPAFTEAQLRRGAAACNSEPASCD